MADLLKCMECGGIVSSEAHQCPQCKTDREGIRGVECKVCLEILKISEATRRSGYFHDSCYQKVSRPIVERKKTINCPVCQQPNHFSYGYFTTPRRHGGTQHINCAKCGHPYLYQPIEKDDPYSNCMYF
jgi:RNA polymerase subunit RPABC4/transcription elongation factor Spt4